ncbi:MAG TPA: amylo-alpha-1,6-glucosidase [Polyangiaceae bacterium]
MTRIEPSTDSEWLEADGLGGFASGTSRGLNTRRYHGLLLVAQSPPADRRVLVNDAVVWLETPAGSVPISEHHYHPGVTSPTGAPVVAFESEPWPCFSHRGSDFALTREIVGVHGLPIVLNRWRFDRPLPGWTLCVRPLLSGRDFHQNHRENAVHPCSAEARGPLVEFASYPGLPRVLSLANAVFEARPDWYRNFWYAAERARGLDPLEDLATPGVLRFDLSSGGADWIVAQDTVAAERFFAGRSAASVAELIVSSERRRRACFASPLERAADAYLVKRGAGKTVIAGYPWFGDWGRDTFIAMRGLCLATGRLEEARDILLAWSEVVDQGMLPNRFPDRSSEAPEYNSVDAALWYATVVGEFLCAPAAPLKNAERQQLVAAVRAIIEGHLAGTRHRIQVASDGLLACGELGVQLTWMDAKVGAWVVTPRIGKPVEVQALWLNALAAMRALTNDYGNVLDHGLSSFRERFLDPESGALFDVVDADHEPGKIDAAIRPNQVFAVGGLPLALLDLERCRRVLGVVEQRLVTPFGLRSLAAGHPDYKARYQGGVLERDSAYHQGTVWPWLMGPFVEAWVRARATPSARDEARQRFVRPLTEQLSQAGIGHVSEVLDAEAPHRAGGCPFQAWSVSELLRVQRWLDRTERASVSGSP